MNAALVVVLPELGGIFTLKDYTKMVLEASLGGRYCFYFTPMALLKPLGILEL